MLLYTPESRAERLIAGGRIALAASALIAVWLDPTEPAKYAAIAYSLLVAYVFYSLLVALLVVRAPAPSNWLRLATHGFDLAFFSLFTYFTSGPAGSPFIAYFVFSMVAATLRWQWRGTLWTAVAALVAFLGLGVYFVEVLGDAVFDLTPFVTRAAYLVVFALLLGYLGAHEERTRREMASLAAWSQIGNGLPGEVMHQLLATASQVLGVGHVVAVTTESEEPWTATARLRGGVFGERRAAPGASQQGIDAELEGTSFLCLLPRKGEAVVLYRGAQGLQTLRRNPVAADLFEGARPVALVSVPLHGETLEGRLFFFADRALTRDDLVLAEIVSGIVAARLDQAYLVRQLRAAAAIDERARLARDLHDGVLQSFTAVGLQVGAARRLAEEHPDELPDHLQELQRLVAEEQRDLRFFIQELQREDTGESDGPLVERLAALGQRIERTWGIRVAFDGKLEAEPGAELGREIYSLVREAVINAARHGDARAVRVVLRERAGSVGVTVEDDGRGFPQRGSFDAAILSASGWGPRSLRERTAALGGSFALHSTPAGARIEIELPASAAGSGAA